MNTDFIKGVIVPIITVIDEEEKINEAAMAAFTVSVLLAPTVSSTRSKKRKWNVDLRSW